MIDVLANRRLTLLHFEKWEDANDKHYMMRYAKEKGLKTLLAICFTTVIEQFHHWKVFADGSAGVCIEFDPQRLLSNAIGDVRADWVKYRGVVKVTHERPQVEKWPFLKREPFADEKELRIIFQDSHQVLQSYPFEIELSSIRRITLAPWLNRELAETVTNLLHSIEGCENLMINSSHLLESGMWRRAIAPIDRRG